MGSRIQAEAVLESFDGRFYTLRVSARDDRQEVGSGTVGRAVVSMAKFIQKMKNRGMQKSESGMQKQAPG